MTISRVGLYVAASWLIAAHFMRADEPVLTGLCVAAPLLFLVHQRWVLPLLQGLAYAASIAWLVTTWHIVSFRQAFGAPWGRSAAILLGVAAVTLLAGLSLRGSAMSKPARAS